MQVRYPELDYSNIGPHWASNLEFAQMVNAGNSIPAYIEPYLVKVMIRAKDMIDPADAKLQEDVAIFIKQEMQHCKQHIAFNQTLTAHYPGVVPLEQKLKADFDGFLAKKSMQFNIAYSEGFESLSAISATSYFEYFDEFWTGASPVMTDLWKWHLAEEYEHRCVMNDTYHALFGNGPFAYLYRVYGFLYAMLHLMGHITKVKACMLEQDRRAMTPEQLDASKAREKHVNKVAKQGTMWHLRQILSPFYNPSKRPAPRGAPEMLARFAPGSVAAE